MSKRNTQPKTQLKQVTLGEISNEFLEGIQEAVNKASAHGLPDPMLIGLLSMTATDLTNISLNRKES